MLKNYFKIAFKVLLRRKFFTFISLFAISFTLIILMVATALAPGEFVLHNVPRIADVTWMAELLAALGLNNVYVKNDTVNPTFSFKDRPVSIASSKALEKVRPSSRTMSEVREACRVHSACNAVSLTAPSF